MVFDAYYEDYQQKSWVYGTWISRFLKTICFLLLLMLVSYITTTLNTRYIKNFNDINAVLLPLCLIFIMSFIILIFLACIKIIICWVGCIFAEKREGKDAGVRKGFDEVDKKRHDDYLQKLKQKKSGMQIGLREEDKKPEKQEKPGWE